MRPLVSAKRLPSSENPVTHGALVYHFLETSCSAGSSLTFTPMVAGEQDEGEGQDLVVVVVGGRGAPEAGARAGGGLGRLPFLPLDDVGVLFQGEGGGSRGGGGGVPEAGSGRRWRVGRGKKKNSVEIKEGVIQACG